MTDESGLRNLMTSMVDEGLKRLDTGGTFLDLLREQPADAVQREHTDRDGFHFFTFGNHPIMVDTDGWTLRIQCLGVSVDDIAVEVMQVLRHHDPGARYDRTIPRPRIANEGKIWHGNRCIGVCVRSQPVPIGKDVGDWRDGTVVILSVLDNGGRTVERSRF
ncbi:MAG: hypothetical protein AAF677_01900 [Pseudomonadota bacterium]